jgi:hypothetical protein
MRLYGAFPGTDGKLDIYGYDPDAHVWQNTLLLETRIGPIRGRPAMAWVPRSSTADAPGRLYLMTVRRDVGGADDNQVSMAISYVKVSGMGTTVTSKEVIGLAGHFDNTWYSAYGADLLYERGVDGNLRAVLTQAFGDTKNEVWFRPNADGILFHSYRSFDDWSVIRLGLCRNVVNPGGTVSGPVDCP